MSPEMIGARAVAEILHVHENTVRNYVREGLLHGQPLRADGTYLRFDRAEVERFAEKLAAEAPENIGKGRGRRGPSTQPSWKEIAFRLGARMANHRYCEYGHDDQADCPFCEDIAAYKLFCAKVGFDPFPDPSGPSMSIQELIEQGEK